MVTGFRDPPGPGIEFLIALHIRTGHQLLAGKGRHGRLPEDFAHQSRTGTHVGTVLLGAQVVEEDLRRLARIAALEGDTAQAGGPHQVDMHLERMGRHQVHRARLHRQGHEGQLQVRVLDPGPRTDKGPGLEMVTGRQAVMADEPARADPPLARCAGPRVQRHRLLAQVLHHRIRMVVETFADAGQVVQDRQPQVTQLRGRADAGQQQQLRRTDRPGGQEHFAPGPGLPDVTVLLVLDTTGPLVLEQDAQRQGTGRHLHIAALQGFAQVTAGGAPAPAVASRAVHRAETFLAIAVQVVARRIAGLLPGRDEGGTQRRADIPRRDMQMPLRTAITVRSIGMVLRADEIRQHFLVAPADAALLRPVVVIPGMPADIHHAVDRRGTAEGTPTGRADPAAVEPRFGFRAETPVVARAADDHPHGGGHVDGPAVVGRSRLQQQDPELRVFPQAVGQDTAGGPGADNQVIEFVLGHDRACSIRRSGAIGDADRDKRTQRSAVPWIPWNTRR